MRNALQLLCEGSPAERVLAERHAPPRQSESLCEWCPASAAMRHWLGYVAVTWHCAPVERADMLEPDAKHGSSNGAEYLALIVNEAQERAEDVDIAKVAHGMNKDPSVV